MNLEQLDALSQKVAKALYIIENLKAEKVNLSTKVSELETELESKQTHISNIEQELGDLQNQSDELQTANTQLQATNEELQQMNTSLQTELEEAQGQDGERDQLIQEAEERLKGVLSSLEGLDNIDENIEQNMDQRAAESLQDQEQIVVSSGETFEFITEAEHNHFQSDNESENGEAISYENNSQDLGENISENSEMGVSSLEPEHEIQLESSIIEEEIIRTDGESNQNEDEEPVQDLFGNLSNQPFEVEDEAPIEPEVNESKIDDQNVFQEETYQTFSVEEADSSFETEEVLEVETPSENVNQISEEEWVDDWDEDVSSVSESPQSGTDYVEEDGVVWSSESDPTEEH